VAGPRRNTARRSDGGLATIDVLGVGALVALGVVARFVTTSPLWLDEALSVNIASLPLGEIGDALRQDGHPPLYYWMLHGWMSVFGDGDLAVRSLSGVAGLASLPLAWEAGRRRAGTAGGLSVLGLTAITPWCVRYATEARMYAVVLTLVFAAWLLADDLLAGRDRLRWAALAVVTGGAVLTHYWLLHLGIAAVAVLGLRWWRGDAEQRAGSVRVASALAVGSLAFVPWLPTFLDQLSSTGTPWASAGRPTGAFVELLAGIGGGGRYPEAVLYGFALLVLVGAGVTVVARGAWELVVDLRTVHGVRSEVVVAAAAMSVGLVAGQLGDAVFVARYAAAFLPMLLIAAGVGLARLPAPALRRTVAVGMVALAAVGLGGNVLEERTMGEDFARAIAAEAGPDDVVAICPDQLGPATLRSLPETIEAVGLPTLDRPDRIDWRDYAERNAAADPASAVTKLLERAEGGSVWFVINTHYRTYEGYCEAVQAGLQAARPTSGIIVPDRGGEVFEGGTLVRFLPNGG
jgi:mannosyltransferase